MPAIEAHHIRKCFGPVTAVNDVSLTIQEGEIFGFLSPNGAGKTTTTRILTGIIPSDGGSVTVLGHDIQTAALLAKQGFGVVPETSNAYVNLTAWQNLMLIGELYGLPSARASRRASDLLMTLGLTERKDQKVYAYSKGMKQRLILALALLPDPELLFLDEPTSGLDVESSRMILSMLRELNRDGTTIFLTTHNMEEADRLCDRVAIIRAGRLVAVDAPEKIRTAVESVHRIEVSFDREIAGDKLAALPGVTGVERTGDKWMLTGDKQDAIILSLADFSRQNHAAIVTLNTLAPSLDDAFLRLTREGSE